MGPIGLLIRSYSAVFEIQSDGRMNTPYTSCFPKMYLIENLTWPFAVIETLIKAHSIGN